MNPKDAEIYPFRGISKFLKGDYDGELADFDKVIEINPKYAEAYFKRGLARVPAKGAKGDFDGAIADFDKAIVINPKYAEAYYVRALAKYLKGDYDGAIADSDKLLEINPRDAEALRIRQSAEAKSKKAKSKQSIRGQQE
jgi:tetratricopeptide (TPR) repeat protein